MSQTWRKLGEYKGTGQGGWNKGRGRGDWSDREFSNREKAKLSAKRQAKTLEVAKNYRDEWTPAEEERIMEDEGVTALSLAFELGRTYTAIASKRTKLREVLEKELDEVRYDGPILYGGDGDDDVDKATLRSATLALLGVAIEKGKTPDHWEMVSLCAMLGHEFEGD